MRKQSVSPGSQPKQLIHFANPPRCLSQGWNSWEWQTFQERGRQPLWGPAWRGRWLPWRSDAASPLHPVSEQKKDMVLRGEWGTMLKGRQLGMLSPLASLGYRPSSVCPRPHHQLVLLLNHLGLLLNNLIFFSESYRYSATTPGCV